MPVGTGTDVVVVVDDSALVVVVVAGEVCGDGMGV